ncbi:unnamed protein product [Penicillium salamii]|nr:unnamed protein product [Penicillium salamii]CAG8244778.1 unnamed protein product [Penicillium salamii]
MRHARWKLVWYGGSGEPLYPLKRPRTRITGEATSELKSIQRSKTLCCNLSSSRIDCFSALPIEIRLEIASYLLTADCFTLRTVSRGMAAIFSLQSFWKTKFHICGDRGFLSYLTEGPQGHQKKELAALRQTWRQNRWLADRCSMVQTLDDQSESDLPLELSGQVPWKTVAIKTHCDRRRRIAGLNKCVYCGLNHTPVTQVVSLKDIIRLVVFVLHEPNQGESRTWITGIDLMSANAEQTITIGYRVPGSHVTLNLYQRQLRGFAAVAGNGGIRALRPIIDSKRLENWIGQPGSDEDGLVGYRKSNYSQIILRDEIKAISAKFDYCKMIGLSIV